MPIWHMPSGKGKEATNMVTRPPLAFRAGRCKSLRALCAAIIVAPLLGMVVPLRAQDKPSEKAPAEEPASNETDTLLRELDTKAPVAGTHHRRIQHPHAHRAHKERGH